MAYVSTDLDFNDGARVGRTAGSAILARLARRIAVLRRKSRRDRFVAAMISQYDGHMLADVGIDGRKARRYDWLGALMGI